MTAPTLVIHGDADAVSFGDYHIPNEIGHALVGHDLDDAALEELLEPYRPHRHRVQALLGTRRWRERHGPRLAPRTHLPTAPRRPRTPRG